MTGLEVKQADEQNVAVLKPGAAERNGALHFAGGAGANG